MTGLHGQRSTRGGFFDSVPRWGLRVGQLHGGQHAPDEVRHCCCLNAGHPEAGSLRTLSTFGLARCPTLGSFFFQRQSSSGHQRFQCCVGFRTSLSFKNIASKPDESRKTATQAFEVDSSNQHQQEMAKVLDVDTHGCEVQRRRRVRIVACLRNRVATALKNSCTYIPEASRSVPNCPGIVKACGRFASTHGDVLRVHTKAP